MSVVGANQWKGGFLQFTSTGEKGESYMPDYMETDSYLGMYMTLLTNLHM